MCNIIHNRYKLPNQSHLHSLTVDGIEGKRVYLSEIARNGDYAAMADIRCSSLPSVFKITDISYKTQLLNKLPLRSAQHKIVGSV